MNSSGGYGASVPLDLPPARGGLPIPLHISYGEHGVGAAGLGWDVPLSFIRRDTTFARHRPVGAPGVDPQAHEQVSLVLEGRRMLLVRTATGWAAQRDAPDLTIREQSDGTWVVFDGQGWTYLFTVADPALAGAGLWHLASVTGPGGNKVALSYTVGHPAVPGAPATISLDLTGIQYNPDATGCYKHAITLGYDGTATSLQSISLIGNTVLARVHPLLTVAVSSRPTCAGSAQTLRSYQLQYTPDPDTGLRRLSSVQMTGRQGTPEASAVVPIASYTYASASSGGQLTYQGGPDISVTNAYPLGDTFYAPSVREYVTDRVFTDFTGDGRVDLVNATPFLRNTPVGPGGVMQFLAGGDFSFGQIEERVTVTPRYAVDPQNPGFQDEAVFQQAIDVNGDGRVDLVMAASDGWIIELNTPDPHNSQNTIWQSRGVSTVALAQHLRERGLWSGDSRIPLAFRSTRGQNAYSACIRWDGPSQRWVEYTDSINCRPDGSLIGSGGPQVTITSWELKDVNRDGYPDVVFNSSPVIMSGG